MTDVEFYFTPFPHGKRAAAYYGPIAAERKFRKFSAETFDRAFKGALKYMAKKTVELKGNAVCGVEIVIDPWGKPPRLYISGTIAKLESLF